MKIINIKLQQIVIPLQRKLVTALHITDNLGCVLLEIETDNGLIGQSYVFSLNKQRLAVLEGMIDSFRHFLLGQSALNVEKIWQQMWRDSNPIGQAGVSVCAISAIDTALWDLLGKQANMPLYQLFGACRDKVKVYASSGLWLSDSIDELLEQAADFLQQGFRSMKLRIGKGTAKEDVERAKALRAFLGDEIEILTDANQSLSVRQALALAKQLEPYNIGWFEEPVAANDLAGCARVREASDIAIASGETDYSSFAMKNILDAQAVDILMPDLQRIGGLSEFRKTAALAAAYHVPISTHIFTEQSLSIAGSAANCISVEHVDWFSPLFEETMQIDNGHVAMMPGAGLGFTFDQAFIEEHQINEGKTYFT